MDSLQSNESMVVVARRSLAITLYYGKMWFEMISNQMTKFQIKSKSNHTFSKSNHYSSIMCDSIILKSNHDLDLPITVNACFDYRLAQFHTFKTLNFGLPFSRLPILSRPIFVWFGRSFSGLPTSCLKRHTCIQKCNFKIISLVVIMFFRSECSCTNSSNFENIQITIFAVRQPMNCHSEKLSRKSATVGPLSLWDEFK